MHYSHFLNIPYENFDIINKIPFSLDEDDLYEKIINNRRGGYCYELIFLFKRLLTKLGYKVDLLSARIVHEPDKILGPEFDHSILLVHLKSKWIADIGNSRWFNEPMMLDSDKILSQNYQTFRIDQTSGSNDKYVLVEKNSDNEFEQPQYYFRLIPRENSDFNGVCHYKWTSPESKFTKEYICTRITERGRILLKSSALYIFEKDVRHVKKIESEDEFRSYLEKYFGSEYLKQVRNYKLQT